MRNHDSGRDATKTTIMAGKYRGAVLIVCGNCPDECQSCCFALLCAARRYKNEVWLSSKRYLGVVYLVFDDQRSLVAESTLEVRLAAGFPPGR